MTRNTNALIKKMETETSRKYDRELLKDIYKQWEKECENEELISLRIWEQNDNLFLKYESNVI